jgi:hypothetical protein
MRLARNTQERVLRETDANDLTIMKKILIGSFLLYCCVNCRTQKSEVVADGYCDDLNKAISYIVFFNHTINQPDEEKILFLAENEYGEDFWMKVTFTHSGSQLTENEEVTVDTKTASVISSQNAKSFLNKFRKLYNFHFQGSRVLDKDCKLSLENDKDEFVAEKIDTPFVRVRVLSDTLVNSVTYFRTDITPNAECENLLNILSIDSLFQHNWIKSTKK